MKNAILFISLIITLNIFADENGKTPLVGREAPTTAVKEKKTGKQAAQTYFQSDKDKESESEGGTFNKPSRSFQKGDHYLALHFGNFVQGDAWNWGQTEKQKETGKSSAGLTYRFDEWGQSDLSIRIDFNEYLIKTEKPLKMSLMPVIIFPEASSRFPLYFGAGAGLGVFFKQIEGESNVSFDYQLFMGARFFNIYDSAGFFIETGLKNHLHLTSDGQFNGTYLCLGALFTF